MKKFLLFLMVLFISLSAFCDGKGKTKYMLWSNAKEHSLTKRLKRKEIKKAVYFKKRPIKKSWKVKNPYPYKKKKKKKRK